MVCGSVSEIVHRCMCDEVLFQCCCGVPCQGSVLHVVDLHIKSASREHWDSASVRASAAGRS